MAYVVEYGSHQRFINDFGFATWLMDKLGKIGSAPFMRCATDEEAVALDSAAFDLNMIYAVADLVNIEDSTPSVFKINCESKNLKTSYTVIGRDKAGEKFNTLINLYDVVRVYEKVSDSCWNLVEEYDISKFETVTCYR